VAALSWTPIYDEIRRRYLLMDAPLPPEPEGRHALPDTAPREFTHDDGTVYERISPGEFPDNDEVDSTDIVDDGAPD
jgi:hypothetical protein